ncbi:MAG: hypothetical protein Q9209_007887 [Squamulea sp. 1 TL-2023]
MRYRSTAAVSAPILINDEFTGLLLRSRIETGPNRFTAESLGLFAIVAMKEQALLDYNEPVLDYDFIDHVHPGPRLRIIIRAVTPSIPSAKVRRSTVMWIINEVAVGMMWTQYLHRLSFNVDWQGQHIYEGSLLLDVFQTAPRPLRDLDSTNTRDLSPPRALVVIPVNSTTIRLKDLSNLNDHPRYDLSFDFLPPSQGFVLSQRRFCQALLALLLQLGKADAASNQPRIAMTRHELYAWVYMMQFRTYSFQQYHAVAIAEAMAEYAKLHGQYQEMTFRFYADGQLSARGCLTRIAQSRQWCRGLFPSSPSDVRSSVGDLVATD